jgi:hypothetical protein
MPQQQQQSAMRESSFIYAGRQFQYRYSTKLFSDRDDYSDAIEVLKDDDTIISRLPNIVFGVCSFALDTIRRDLIRNTWGSQESQVFFMIANPTNDQTGNVTSMIMKEFHEHGDLIWLDIPENYRNALTPKTFAWMHFTNHHYLAKMEDGTRVVLDLNGKVALGIDYIFKTDSDVFVNTTEISVELEAKGKPEYYGLNAYPVIFREGDTKFVTTWEEYPRDAYPPYAHGWGYAISTQSAFFQYQEPVHTPTIGMPHAVLANVSTSDYALPPMVTVDQLMEVSSHPQTMALSCTEQVMASMLPMPWEDVGSGLLMEACNVSMAYANDEWHADRPEFYMYGGVLVKVVHDVEPQWFEALMHREPLEGVDVKKFRKRRKYAKPKKKRKGKSPKRG